MIALIDADILLYKFSHHNEEWIEWGDDQVSYKCDEKTAKAELDMFVEDLIETTGCTSAVLVLSGGENFRYDVDPTYKHNRSERQESELRNILKQYILDTYDPKVKVGLEGDDVLGIMGTMKPGKYVICSIDKDLKQIPGRHYNWDKDEFVEVDGVDGEAWFIQQIIQGDPGDGYTGCPGAGPKLALEFLEDPFVFDAYIHEFKRGARKGETEVRWMRRPKADDEPLWFAILSIYKRYGYDEGYALRQARMAKILDAEHYDFINEKPKLWSPYEVGFKYFR